MADASGFTGSKAFHIIGGGSALGGFWENTIAGNARFLFGNGTKPGGTASGVTHEFYGWDGSSGQEQLFEVAVGFTDATAASEDTFLAWSGLTAGAGAEWARLVGRNLCIGVTTAGASMTQGLSIKSGTAPTGNVTDAFQHYSADHAAGQAAPHWRVENGDVVHLAKHSTITQTYSTATTTHSNPTATALTDNSGGTANTTLQSIGAAYVQAEVRNNFADLAASNNAIIVDIANVKQVVNQLVDAMQSLGLLG
jgi:hypothetical protein